MRHPRWTLMLCAAAFLAAGSFPMLDVLGYWPGAESLMIARRWIILIVAGLFLAGGVYLLLLALQAMLLLDLARRHAAKTVRKFEYRAQHPIFAGSPFSVNGNFDARTSQADVWTANETGNIAMRGTASF